MKLLLLNPNTHEPMTRDMESQGRRYARPGTEIEGITARFGAPSVEGYWEEQYAIFSFLETIAARGSDCDGIILSCYGDPGIGAAREMSPVPVLGIAEASMHFACVVAYKFSIVTLLPRMIPFIADMVKLHGFESRCASIRATSSSVLGPECDPEGSQRDLVAEARAAIAEDGAEAICLGCGGLSRLYDALCKSLEVPVIDGIPAAVKIMEGIVDCGLQTSRVAAYKQTKPKKEFIPYTPLG